MAVDSGSMMNKTPGNSKIGSTNPFNSTALKNSNQSGVDTGTRLKMKKSDKTKNRPTSGRNPPGLTAVKLDYKSSGTMPEINASYVDVQDDSSGERSNAMN